MLTTSYPRFSGDVAGIFVSRLCKALHGTGLEVDVVAPADKSGSLCEEVEGTRVHRFRYFFPKRLQGLAYGDGGGIPVNLHRNPWLFFQLPFFFLMFFIKSLRVSKKAEVLHANWIYVGLIAWGVCLLRGIPFIVTLRGSDIERAQKNYFELSLSLFILNRASAVTTVSQDFKKWAVSKGLPEERVFTIRNGVDLFPLAHKQNDTQRCDLLFVGSLIPRKGLDVLFETLCLLVKWETHFTLNIVGDGAEKRRLMAKVTTFGLGDAVQFSGSISPDSILHIMQQADCLVLPSLSEGTPNVVLEAMACGLPVVASDLPGIRELVTPGLNGFLFESQNVEAMAAALSKIITDQSLRGRMGKCGREMIEKMGLSWQQSALNYLECYQTACVALRDTST